MIEIIQCGFSNCYLIIGKKGSILVDTGMPSGRDKIVEAVKDKNLKLILLTHGHGDHTGNAAYLKKLFNVPIAMHEADYQLSKDNTLKPLYADTLVGKMVRMFSKPGLKKKVEPFEPDLFMESGDDLRPYGVNGEIMELPGHTAGSIGVWTRTEVVVGDAMMNVVRPYGARLYEDKEQAKKSLEVIRATQTMMIYVGHGKPIEFQRFFSKA